VILGEKKKEKEKMACVSRHPHFANEKFHYITLP
jgi:hypothetical protein